MYELIQTDSFEKDFEKTIPNNLKDRVKKQLKKLEKDPYIGKPLSYSFLRELKIDKFRVYYMVYKETITVLLVAVGDKKTQNKMIEKLKIKENCLKGLHLITKFFRRC